MSLVPWVAVRHGRVSFAHPRAVTRLLREGLIHSRELMKTWVSYPSLSTSA